MIIVGPVTGSDMGPGRKPMATRLCQFLYDVLGKMFIYFMLLWNIIHGH